MPGMVGMLQGPGVIVNGAVTTNPLANVILVDSGPLNFGNYLFAVTGSTSADAVYDLEIRDAADAVTLTAFRRRVAAGNEDFVLGFKFAIGSQQRVRTKLIAGIVGDIQLSLIYGEVG